MRKRYTLSLPRGSIELGQRTAVMGILNITPDSFSDGGHYFDLAKSVDRGMEMQEQRADILDIGGESSRPGSVAVSEDEEIRRVLPVIEALAPLLKIPISVDTYRASVARRAIQAGAQIVNDISAFRFDADMPRVVLESGAAAVLMHSRGTRETLHLQTPMQDPLREVLMSLEASVQNARNAGIASDAIVIDPGIGFGKAADESLRVLKSLEVFSKLSYPLLVGTSRKSFIRLFTDESPDARNWGTAATIVASILNGAHIVRVHDVQQARALADMTDRIAG